VSSVTGRTGYFGDYATWRDAERAATPTSDADRRDAAENAARLMRRVRDGEVAYARDGVAFDRVEPPWALLAFLACAAVDAGGRLSLVDFGGAFGATYFQTRGWLARLATLRWAVVELPEVVTLGRRDFTSEELSFHASLAEARRTHDARLILLSGVLSYVPDLDALLAEVRALDFDWILFDRTALIETPRPRLAVQAMATERGEVSWPCRLLTRDALLAPFALSHALVAEFPSFCDADETIDGAPLRHRGFALRRR